MWRAIVAAVLAMVCCGAALRAQAIEAYDFEIAPLRDANSEENDYAPTLSSDRRTLWFCSYGRPEGFGNTDIYRMRSAAGSAASRNAWDAPVDAGASWNGEENEGALAITRDGRTAIVAMDGGEGFGDTDLYIAELRDDTLVDLRNLGREINSRYWDSQPTISGDGTTLYFASNRPGGRGGVDIWTSSLIDGKWSHAFPLDTTINTEAHERSPYLIANGTVLYFTSDRPGGRGGEDVWMAIREEGEWHAPVNLGAPINSSDHELFFHAPPDYDYFFFASTRGGGAGGLDIYSGSPNVFGEGFFRLNVRVVDTLTGLPAAVYVTVTDMKKNRVIREFATDGTERSYEELLPAGRDYRVTAFRKVEGSGSAEVLETRANEPREAIVGFGIPPEIVQVESSPTPYTKLILFDLGEYNVPFFVTGYYRPNTPESLPELLDLLRGPLAQATYIERFPRGSARHNEYRGYARRIDSIFGAMAVRIVDEIAPTFLNLAEPDEVMELIVTGYVDPQVFSGAYLENVDVEFADTLGARHVIRKGDVIGNFELSGMRAVYARDLIDTMLRRKAAGQNRAFLDLLESGRVRYRAVAGGVSGGPTEYDRQRRIHVLIVRR